MKQTNILLTGGSGRLGTELQKHMTVTAPTHKEFDVTKINHLYTKVDMVIHAAGYTNVGKAEYDIEKCMDVNYLGTYKLARYFSDTPFVYISSEYALFPHSNMYALSKYLGEEVVKKYCNNYLIIRTTFKPRPYPYDRAWIDQYTLGDYVDVIAPLIVKTINEWDGENDIVYVGTGRKSIYELAKQTKPDVKPETLDVLTTVTLPRDYL